jgi:hypothetical protein
LSILLTPYRDLTSTDSDPIHTKARASFLATSGYKTQLARFRQHNELLYSLRAARQATAEWPVSVWHIITSDVADPRPAPAEAEAGRQHRLGLLPEWLDINCTLRNTQNQRIVLHHGDHLHSSGGRL